MIALCLFHISLDLGIFFIQINADDQKKFRLNQIYTWLEKLGKFTANYKILMHIFIKDSYG